MAFPKTATVAPLAAAAGALATDAMVSGGDKKVDATKGAPKSGAKIPDKSGDKSADTTYATAEGNKALQVQVQMLQPRDATAA